MWVFFYVLQLFQLFPPVVGIFLWLAAFPVLRILRVTQVGARS